MSVVKLLRNQRVCISINPGYVQQNEQKWCFALCMYMYVYWLFVAVGSTELIHLRHRLHVLWLWSKTKSQSIMYKMEQFICNRMYYTHGKSCVEMIATFLKHKIHVYIIWIPHENIHVLLKIIMLFYMIIKVRKIYTQFTMM